MKTTFDTQKRLECALAGLPIVRTLKQFGLSMAYKEFAILIGLLDRNDTWKGHYHAGLVGDTLYLIRAVANEAGEDVDTDCVVNDATGKPGQGARKTARIVIGDDPTPIKDIERSRTGRTTYAKFGVWRDKSGFIHFTIPRGAQYPGLEDFHFAVKETSGADFVKRLYGSLEKLLEVELPDDEKVA